MELDPVADRLFTLPPNQFVKARDAAVADARREGKRELAAAIKALRRPTGGAWAGNLLAHQCREQLGQLLDLGAAMRAAQANADATHLRDLSRQGRQLIGALITEAKRLAGDLGQPLTAAATQEVDATLNAALADAGAADQLRAGRLALPLCYAGLGTAVMGDAGRARSLSPPLGDRSPVEENVRTDDVRPREDQERAHPVAKEAQLALTAAESHLAELQRQLGAAALEHGRCHRRVVEAERELEGARSTEEEAERALGEVREALAAAEAEVARLRQEVAEP